MKRALSFKLKNLKIKYIPPLRGVQSVVFILFCIVVSGMLLAACRVPQKTVLHHDTKAASSSEDQAQICLRRAELFMKAGNYQAAYMQLAQAISSAPKDPAIQLNMGWVYLYTDDLEKANAAVQKVLTIDPENKEAYHLKGAIYSYLEQEQDAVNYYQKATDSGRNENPELYYHLGNSYLNLNQFDPALKSYQAALTQEEKDPERDLDSIASYQFSICSTYYRLKNFRKAQIYCQKALSSTKNPEQQQEIADFIENLKLLQSI